MTISLVLPAIYKLLGNLEKDYLRQHWDDTTVPVASIGHNVKEALKKYLADLTRRWVTELSTDTKRLLLIATLLDPRYKHYAFRSEGERRWAETALRIEWQHWKVAQNESTNVLNQGNQPKRPRDFLDDSDDDKEQAPAEKFIVVSALCFASPAARCWCRVSCCLFLEMKSFCFDEIQSI